MSRTDSGGAKRRFPSAPPTKHETPSGVFCFERRTLSRLQKPSSLKRSARVPNFSMQILRISMKSGDRRSLRSFSSEVFRMRPVTSFAQIRAPYLPSRRIKEGPRRGAFFFLRRGRDLNPRRLLHLRRFQGARIRPLCHLAKTVNENDQMQGYARNAQQ